MISKIENDVKIVLSKPTTLADKWLQNSTSLQSYILNNDLDNYNIDNVHPQVFLWPMCGQQNIKQFDILKQTPETIFYNACLSNISYGPKNIKLYSGVQLDRVAQVWSLWMLKNFNFNDENQIIFEFGGGTGQMGDVLQKMNFKGKHIIYDLPLMTVLQKHFVSKEGNKTQFILDDLPLHLINGANYLPCNQIEKEKEIMNLKNISFIATYSLTESDCDTRKRFKTYLKNCDRIFIIYQEQWDNYINIKYMRELKESLELTHICSFGDNYGNGTWFYAEKNNI